MHISSQFWGEHSFQTNVLPSTEETLWPWQFNYVVIGTESQVLTQMNQPIRAGCHSSCTNSQSIKNGRCFSTTSQISCKCILFLTRNHTCEKFHGNTISSLLAKLTILCQPVPAIPAGSFVWKMISWVAQGLRRRWPWAKCGWQAWKKMCSNMRTKRKH